MSNTPFVLILAGGSGERFWPLSRRAKPKQLLKLLSDQSLLEETLSRLQGFVPPERILILTNQDQEAAVRGMLPGLPEENIVAEPAKRDTAAAIALAVGWVARRDPTATMIVFARRSRHPRPGGVPARPRRRRRCRRADRRARDHRPQANVGVPRIRLHRTRRRRGDQGNARRGEHRLQTCAVSARNPRRNWRRCFFDSGSYRWNAGMFAWTLPAVLRELSAQIPALADFVSQVRGSKDVTATLAELFPHLPKISIDYAIMENAARVLVLEAGFDWNDVGSWIAVAGYLPKDEHENAANCKLTTLDARENIVFSDRPGAITLLGVSDLIVVQTADATLICHRHEAERIKLLTSKVDASLQ